MVTICPGCALLLSAKRYCTPVQQEYKASAHLHASTFDKSQLRWYNDLCYGRVSERFKELVLKTSVPATVPWVRIPHFRQQMIHATIRGRVGNHGEVPKWLKGSVC